MSEKFNAKNLSYNKALPPFLAALKNQHGSSQPGPNPLLAANRRHGAKRSGSAEAEDAPVVVDEEGNVVDAKLEGDGTVRYEEVAEPSDKGDKKENKKDEEEGKTVSIGKKRKARVVGAGQEDEETPAKKRSGEGADKVKKKTKDEPSGAGEKASDGKSAKVKKKAKKIKLSFDEDA